MRYATLILLSLLLPVLSMARVITGSVTDSQGAPIPDASVFVSVNDSIVRVVHSGARNLRPVTANVQVNYNILDNLYVAVCLQGFAGDYRSIVTTTNGTYRSEAFTRLKDSGLHPWILIRWNIRKNVKRKIRLDKVLDSQESGIHLTR